MPDILQTIDHWLWSPPSSAKLKVKDNKNYWSIYNVEQKIDLQLKKDNAKAVKVERLSIASGKSDTDVQDIELLNQIKELCWYDISSLVGNYNGATRAKKKQEILEKLTAVVDTWNLIYKYHHFNQEPWTDSDEKALHVIITYYQLEKAGITSYYGI